MTKHVWSWIMMRDWEKDPGNDEGFPHPYIMTLDGSRYSAATVRRKLNENETLKADKRLLMHVVHGRAMASSLPKHLKEDE